MMAPRQLLTRRFVAMHVLIAVAALGFGALGVWQLDRRAEVRADNLRLSQRLAMAPVPLGQLASDGLDPAEAEFRRVEVTGRFLPAEEVLQRSRAHQGTNGFHVLTPLEYADGQAVLVRRGWVPFDLDTPPVTDALPPDGEVTVAGFLDRSTAQPGFGARDPVDGELEQVFHADVERIGRQVTPALLPMVLHLEAQVPTQPGELPIPAARPEFDESNHLSYALQWFSFATIAVVGYAIFIRSRLRRSDRPAEPPARERDDSGRLTTTRASRR